MKVALSRSYHLGWWPSGCSLDRFDLALSLPILTLELGWLEYLIAVPGTWFSLPHFVWGVVPLYLALFVSDADPVHLLAWFLLLCLPLTLACAFMFFRAVYKSNLMSVYRSTKHILFPCSIGPTTLARFTLGERSGHAAALVLCSWIVAETISHIVKISARRMRPMVAFADRLRKVKRVMPELQRIVSKGETAVTSFPSGDAAGAASIVYVFHACQVAPLWLLATAALLCCFGRVYLLAHHVFDVVAGTLIGIYSARFVVLRNFLQFEVPAELRTAARMSPKQNGEATEEEPDIAGITMKMGGGSKSKLW